MPGIVGAGCVLATQDWHRQNLLASGAFSPPNVGTARDFWRGGGRTNNHYARPR